jgi:hypothetical protein
MVAGSCPETHFEMVHKKIWHVYEKKGTTNSEPHPTFAK